VQPGLEITEHGEVNSDDNVPDDGCCWGGWRGSGF